jgi:signal transduction histidine kinase
MSDSRASMTRPNPVGTPSLQAMKQMLEAIQRAEPRLATQSPRGGPQIDDLKRLLEISQAINSVLDLDLVLDMVMEYAIKLVGAERGFIMLLDEGRLVPRRMHNLAPEHFGKDGDRISQTIASRVLQTGQSIYTSDAQEDERFVERQSVHDLHLRSIMGVPLKHDDLVVGVIYLDNSSQARLFLQSDLYILELLAQQASIALANAAMLHDIRHLQAYAENIVASAPMALFVLDASAAIQRCNERGRLLLSELGDRDFHLLPWLELVETGARNAWAAMFRDVLQSGHANSWSRHPMKIGAHSRVYRVNASPLSTGTDQPAGLVLTLDDITESERMREELLKAEVSMRKADQIGDIAHEINNFLTILSNQAEINQRWLSRGETDKISESTPRMLEAVDKISRLVEGLLRPDRIEPQPCRFALHTAVRSLEIWLGAEKRFDLVTLEFSIPSDLPEVYFDPQHFEMALYNLCKNAAEAMADSGSPARTIRITAGRAGDFVQITVADSGPGLPPERQASPWEQGFSSKASGHGRGLHNTADFIRRNGGKIEVDAKGSLGGAEFRVLLPVADA